MWLIAAVGLFLGAFPVAEGKLFSSAHLVVLLVVVGVITVTAGVQVRSRMGTAHPFWDILIATGSVVTTFGWGVLLATLLRGIPIDVSGRVTGAATGFVDPFAILFGVCMVALFTVHGASFLALRLNAGMAARAQRWVTTTAPIAFGLVCAVTAYVLAAGDLRTAINRPLLAAGGLAVLLAALLAVRYLNSRAQPGKTFAASGIAVGLPVLVVSMAIYPNIVLSTIDPAASLTLTEAAAAPETLDVLIWFAVPVLPTVLAFQAMCWWVYRGRVTERSPLYF